MDFIHEAGWPIYPVMLFGFSSLLLAVRHAAVPQRSLRPLVNGLAAAAVLFGLCGTALGMITSVRGLDGVADPALAVRLFLKGLQESLNNAAAGTMLATASIALSAIGSYRMERRREEVG